jgi:hypothetical protein
VNFKRNLAVVVTTLVAVGLATTPAMASDANGNHEAYQWVVGNDTSMAPDGSTIKLFGVGTLTAGPDKTTTTIVGTFTKSGGETGTWKATAIDGFVSYGTKLPGQTFPGPPATGGKAKLRVSLSNGETGLLTIFCVIGSPPPSTMEGVHLVLGSGVSGEYNTIVVGATIFRAI